MKPIDFTARLNMQLNQASLANISSQLGQQFRSTKITVPVEVGSAAGINGVSAALQQASARAAELATRMGAAAQGTTATASSLGNLTVALSAARSRTEAFNAATTQAAATTARFETGMTRLGQRLAGLNTSFSLSSALAISFGGTLRNAVREAAAFERGLVGISQVSNATAADLKAISTTIGQISTQLGVSSSGLNAAAIKLAQAGAAGRDLQDALTAVAKASLDPAFGTLDELLRGSVASMRAFGLQGRDLEKVLSSVKSVARETGTEASGLLAAMQTSGAAVKNLGGNYRELLAIFGTLRATSGQTAEAVASALPNILSRLERGSTIESLRQLGIELRHTASDAKDLGDLSLEGKFTGPLESIRRISFALKDLRADDSRVIGVAEQLGGVRNLKLLVPLLQSGEQAQKTLTAATFAGNQVGVSAAQTQDTLIQRTRQLQEQMLSLGRTVSESAGFRGFATFMLEAAKGAARLAEVLTPLLPVVQGLAVAKLALSFRDLGGALFNSTGAQLRRAGFADGGVVPGTGNTDSVPAVLTPGEFVIKKDSAQKIGYSRLHSINVSGVGGHSALGEPQWAGHAGKSTRWGASDTNDQVPALLMPGEYVVGKHAADRLGLATLRRMNEWGEAPGFAWGGLVQHFDSGSRSRVKPLLPKAVSNALIGHSLNEVYRRLRRSRIGPVLEKQGLLEDMAHREIIMAAPLFDPRRTTRTATSTDTPFTAEDVLSGHPRVINHFSYIVTRRAINSGARALSKLGFEQRATDLGDDWVYDPAARLDRDLAPRNKGGRPPRSQDERAAQYATIGLIQKTRSKINPATGKNYTLAQAMQLAGVDYTKQRYSQLLKEKAAAGYAHGGLVQLFARGDKVLPEDVRNELFSRNFPAILARVQASKFGQRLGDEAEGVAQLVALRRAETFNPTKVREEKGSDVFPFTEEHARTGNERLDAVFRGYAYRSIRRELADSIRQVNRERTGRVGSGEGEIDPSARLDARDLASPPGRKRLDADPERLANVTAYVRQIQGLTEQGLTLPEALGQTPFQGRQVPRSSFLNWQSLVETGQTYNDRARLKRAGAQTPASPPPVAEVSAPATPSVLSLIGPRTTPPVAQVSAAPPAQPFDFSTLVADTGTGGPATFSAVAAPPAPPPPPRPPAPPASPPPPDDEGPRPSVVTTAFPERVRRRIAARDRLYDRPDLRLPIEATPGPAQPRLAPPPPVVPSGAYGLLPPDYQASDDLAPVRPRRRRLDGYGLAEESAYSLESSEAEARRLRAARRTRAASIGPALDLLPADYVPSDDEAPGLRRRRRLNPFGSTPILTTDEIGASLEAERQARLGAVKTIGDVQRSPDPAKFRSTTLAGVAGGDAGPVVDAELFRVKREFIDAHRRQILALDKNLSVAQATAQAQLTYEQALEQGARVLVGNNGRVVGLESTARELRAGGLAEGGVGRLGLFGRQFSERAAAVGGSALFLAGSFAPQFSGSVFGHVEQNKSDAANATAATGEGAAGALTGATTGAAVGLVFGPWGAAIGAAAGGLLGFTSSLRDAEGKIAQFKFDKVSEEAGKNFKILSSSAEFSGERLQRAGVDITRLIGEGKKEGDRRSREAAGFFGSVSLDEFQKNRKLGIDKALAPVLGDIGQISDRLVQDIAKRQDRQAGGTTAARVFETFAAGNVAAIEALKTTGQSAAEIRKHFVDLAQATLRNERAQQAASNSATDLANRLFNFKAVAGAFDQARDALSGLQQRSRALSDLFAGHLGAPAADLPSVSALRLGQPDGAGFNAAVAQVTGGLGGAGAEVRRQAASADVLARVLPDVLRTNAGRGLGGERFGPAVVDQLRRLGVSEEHTGEVRNQIEQLSTRDQSGFITKLARGSNAEAESLARNVTAPIQDALTAAAHAVREQANQLAANLALAAENQRKILHEQDRYGELQGAVIRNAALRAAQAVREPGRALDFLSIGAANAPFAAQQARLGAAAGLNANQSLDPAALLGRFRQVFAAIDPATQRLNAQTFGTPGFAQAATALQNLHTQAVYLKDAMKNLTDASRQNAIVQEKLAQIEGEREGRRNLGERLLAGGPSDILRVSQGANLAAIAGRQGNLAGFDFSNIKTLFEFLDSTANVKLKGLGGVTGRDLKNQLVDNSAPAIAQLTGPDQKTEADLKSVFDQNLNKTIAAQEAFIQAQREIAGRQEASNLGVADAQNRFLDRLGGMHQTFLGNLHKALTAAEITKQTTELGKLEGERNTIQERSTQAGFLKAIGVSSDAVLGRLRSPENRQAITSYLDLARGDQETRSRIATGFKELNGRNDVISYKDVVPENLFMTARGTKEGTANLADRLREKFGLGDDDSKAVARTALARGAKEIFNSSDNFDILQQAQRRLVARGVQPTYRAIEQERGVIRTERFIPILRAALEERQLGVRDDLTKRRADIAQRLGITPEAAQTFLAQAGVHGAEGVFKAADQVKSFAEVKNSLDSLNTQIATLNTTITALNRNPFAAATPPGAPAVAATPAAPAAAAPRPNPGQLHLAEAQARLVEAQQRLNSGAGGAQEVYEAQKNLEDTRKFLGFAGGGLVAPSDTVPAMLTPGEFVVKRAAAQANLPLLNRINGFAAGGVVGGVNAAFGPSGIFPQVRPAGTEVGGVAALQAAVNDFGARTSVLVSALQSLQQLRIELSARHFVEVVHNGVEVFSQMTPAIREMVVAETAKQYQRVMRRTFPDAGASYDL